MFEGYDGHLLRYAIWQATRGPRRGTVCLFEGRTEYIEKYFETVSDLRRRGFAVAIMDWRGQGGSARPVGDPRKGHVADFSEYDRDLRCFMRNIVLPDCPPPFIALGHSMGGHIALRNMAEPGSWFERAVLCAPMVELTAEVLGFPRVLVQIYARLGVASRFAKSYVRGGSDSPGYSAEFEGNMLTSDRERFRRNTEIERTAPQLLLGSPTIGWLDAALRSIGRMRDPNFPQKVRVPCLLFGAGQDRIVDTRASELFAARLKSATYVRLPDARHEILQENDDIRARFWATFDAYFDIPQRAAIVA
jgi:lysophospholipase